MKTIKLFMLSFLMMTSVLSFSQVVVPNTAEEVTDQVTELVTNSDVEKLVDKYSAKIEASLISLAETLKQPAEYVYKIMIRQQYVKATVGLIPWLLVLISIPLMFIGFKYATWDDAVLFEILAIISTAAFLISLIFAIINLQDVIQGFGNPEYGAMQDIIKLFK